MEKKKSKKKRIRKGGKNKNKKKAQAWIQMQDFPLSRSLSYLRVMVFVGFFKYKICIPFFLTRSATSGKYFCADYLHMYEKEKKNF